MPGVFKKQDRWKYSDLDDSPHSDTLSSSAVSTNNFVEIPNMKGGTKSRFPNGYSSDQRSDITDDGPRYLLEHLATFSVGPEYGLMTPKDGLRRLLQMEKTNGIWTQKMQLKLDKNWILILDYEDGDVVERFPMNLISDPTAYTTDDPRELYNNILVFIVRKDPTNQNPSEMHIFQCVHAYAQDVVDEIKMFLTGQVKAKYNENVRHLPPPPDNPPPEPPMDSSPTKGNVKEHVAMLTASSVSSPSPRPPQRRSASNTQHMVERSERSAGYAHESNDETSSTASDKYEREVMILNHCFDDIERFVVRLQHAAAAYKELERRQRSRKHKKKDMGDGMLSVRAKPPPERDFVDILQKFKLSFNLLAKLKSHIHDPNAPELVHFLFTPLALIVDAARDSNHSPNLAERVVSPLLTRDAIELLSNCCTSKETDLWHSLGDAWVVSRDQWKGYESSYNPVFSNGWAPENPIDDDTLAHRLRKNEADLHEQEFQHTLSHVDQESRYGSEYFESERGDDPDGPESHGGISDTPHLRPPFDHQYDHRTAVQRRDLLERGRLLSPESDFPDPNDRDVRSEYSSDSIEHSDVPANLQRQFDHRQMQWLEDLKNRRAKIVQVVYPRTANNDKELTVIRGEILEVLDDSRKWWKARNMRGQVAHVPHTIVMPYPLTDDQIFNNPLYANRSSRESHSSGDSATIKERFIDERSVRPPDEVFPSPVVPQPTQADWVRRERQDETTGDEVLCSEEESEGDDGADAVEVVHFDDEDNNSSSSSGQNVAPKSNAGIQTEVLSSPTSNVSLGSSPEHHVPPQWVPPPPLHKTSEVANSASLQEESSKTINLSSKQKDVENLPTPTPSTSSNESQLQQSESQVAPSPPQEPTCSPPEVPSTESEKTASSPLREQKSLHALFAARNPGHVKEPIPKKEKENKKIIDTGTAQGRLQEELRETIAQKKGLKVWKKAGCPEHQTPECYYINQNSTEQDVSHWLKLKGFSERAREVLKQMTGGMLFRANQQQLENYLGDEGPKLYRLLVSQKNICGFNTPSSKELKSILAERRQKTDIDI